MFTMMLPILSAAGGGSAAAAGTTLVVWFSRGGNTRVIGGQIARSLQAERFESTSNCSSVELKACGSLEADLQWHVR